MSRSRSGAGLRPNPGPDVRAQMVLGGRPFLPGLAQQLLHHPGDVIAGRTDDPAHVDLELAGGRIDGELDFGHRSSSLIPDLNFDQTSLDRSAGGAVQATGDLGDDALAVGSAQLYQELPAVEGPLVVLGQNENVALVGPGETQVVGGAADVLATNDDLG